MRALRFPWQQEPGTHATRNHAVMLLLLSHYRPAPPLTQGRKQPPTDLGVTLCSLPHHYQRGQFQGVVLRLALAWPGVCPGHLWAGRQSTLLGSAWGRCPSLDQVVLEPWREGRMESSGFQEWLLRIWFPKALLAARCRCQEGTILQFNWADFIQHLLSARHCARYCGKYREWTQTALPTRSSQSRKGGKTRYTISCGDTSQSGKCRKQDTNAMGSQNTMRLLLSEALGEGTEDAGLGLWAGKPFGRKGISSREEMHSEVGTHR